MIFPVAEVGNEVLADLTRHSPAKSRSKPLSNNSLKRLESGSVGYDSLLRGPTEPKGSAQPDKRKQWVCSWASYPALDRKSVSEQIAQHNRFDQRGCGVVVVADFVKDLIDGCAVGWFDATAEGMRQEPFGDGAEEERFAL